MRNDSSNSLLHSNDCDKDRRFLSLKEYLDSLFTNKPVSYNVSAPMLASICRTILLSPDEVYAFIMEYCEKNNIKLEVGNE